MAPNQKVASITGMKPQYYMRYLDVKIAANKLGLQLYAALPGFRALTGYDSTGVFIYKERAQPYSILEKYLECYMGSFKQIGKYFKLPAIARMQLLK